MCRGRGVQALPAAGGTGHTVTMTQTQHGTWTETGDTDFCTGETISPTFTASFKATAVDSAGATHVEVGHEVMHIAFNATDPINPVVTFDKLSVTCS